MLLKKYSDLGGGKKNNRIQEFLSYNLMFNSGKKNCTLRDKKDENSNSRPKKKISVRKQTIAPPAS